MISNYGSRPEKLPGLSRNGLLMREVYDPAVHFTRQEYKERHGGKGVDIQSRIEVPHVLYMLGVSGAKDSDQLAFLPTQRECLRELQFTEVYRSNETASVM